MPLKKMKDFVETSRELIDIGGDATISGTLGVTGVLTGTSLDISGDIDIDGTTNLDVVDIDGAVDMASTLQVDGAITSSAGATITTADNTDTLTLTSTDADGNPGPVLNYYRNSGSAADNDYIGRNIFTFNNDAPEIETALAQNIIMTDENFIHTVFIGSNRSGKSNIVNRMRDGSFIRSYIPTIGAFHCSILAEDYDFSVKTWEFSGNKVYKLQIIYFNFTFTFFLFFSRIL